MDRAPTFDDFYRAVNGRPPFPWQTRLAAKVAKDERWPGEIGVPTGAGKTACLDIAVWWLASQADREPARRTAPTRIWWVVNRRLLVDSTAEHADKLARALEDPDKAGLSGTEREVVAAVALRLSSLSAGREARPLDVIRLRGGVASRTPTDPSRPTVILCTLPMYGSRLLFRGYGSTLRPIDAALAGTDSLVLLDEAHLAPHLTNLLPALADCIPGAEALLGEYRSQARLTELTATGNPSGQRFDLDDEDRRNCILRRRLDASKPLEVREPRGGKAAKRLADAARELLKGAPPAACLVFANTPKTARETFEDLRKGKRVGEADFLLLTGLSREREAERVRARILDPVDGMAATRPEGSDRSRHLVVVATQTLEVGADVDAEYLVTEACGVRALTQRLGRLNRLGRHPHARAVYVHLPPPGKDKPWPVYGAEPVQVLEKLKEARAGGESCVDLPPARVAEVLGPPEDHAGRAPEVLPGILWEWTKTTTPPEGEAPVEPYFSGIAGAQYAVSLIWRVHVPEEGERLWPRAADREAVDVPIGEVKKALNDEVVRRLAYDGVTVEEIAAERLRPGDQVVLPADRGLLDEFGWNPEASQVVVDVSLARHGLPLDETAIKRLCGLDLGREVGTALGTADDDEEVDQDERDAAVESILAQVKEQPTPPGWDEDEWAAFTQALRPSVQEARGEVSRLPVETKEEDPRGDFGSEDDELSMSLGPAAVQLDAHGREVGMRARAIARRIGLPSDLVEVVELAGDLHDVGKSDSRFQRWLAPKGSQGVLLAKSDTPRHRWEATRRDSGWPRGGRHEDLSARLVRAWLEQDPSWGTPEDRELLVHLVVSHHGKGRPLVLPPVLDGTADALSAVVRGVSVQASADLAVVDWGQPRRFRRLNDRFGPWGLALLEAVVRQADHAVSAGARLAQEEP